MERSEVTLDVLPWWRPPHFVGRRWQNRTMPKLHLQGNALGGYDLPAFCCGAEVSQAHTLFTNITAPRVEDGYDE